MAKKSAIEKNNRRMKMAERLGPVRAELRKKVSNPNLSEEERYEAHLKLQKMPRDSSPCRVVSRCFVTGRPRGTLRKFGLSRIAFREMALHGRLPGVTKASW
ncbi:MAG: 30S ribosomal protein S14 [Bdellovibrionales bacterium]|nr:30S ribosomal protein S14 [Bdellovibrionales bacterium]